MISATTRCRCASFAELGWGSVIVGIAFVVLIPLLRKLIRDTDALVVDVKVAVVSVKYETRTYNSQQ